jgi:hypothetical protein
MLKVDEMNKKFLLVSLLSLILILSAFGPVLQATVFNGDLRITRDMDVDRNLNVDGNIVVDGTTTLDGNSVSSGDLSVGADFSVTGLTTLVSQSLSITAAFIVTPTSSFVNLNPPFEITSTTDLPIAMSGITTGTLLLLRNDDATSNINLDGTGGSVECTADIVLEPSDIVMLIFNGTAWNCLSNFDN